MGHRSGIDHVRKQKPERRPAQWSGRMMLSVARRPFLRCEPPFPYLPYRGLKATRFLTDTEHFPDLPGFLFVYDQLSALGGNVVAQYRISSDPFTFAPGGGKFIARTFTDNLPF